MRIRNALAPCFALVPCLMLLAACGGGSSSSPAATPPVSTPAPSSSLALYAQQQGVSVASLTRDDDFRDLEPVGKAIDRARIVQLGESSHGSREMNQMKTRLIKYLHQKQGFNVISFESSVLSCNLGREREMNDAAALMRSCIFGVWHTQEVAELFRYILASQATDRPLRLSGMDMQVSVSDARFRLDFQPFFQRVLSAHGRVANLDLTKLAEDILAFLRTGRACADETTPGSACAALRESGDTLNTRLAALQTQIEALTGADAALAHIAVNATQDLVRAEISSIGQRELYSRTRDASMGRIQTRLLNEVYPQDKIMIWAHNYHIANDYHDIDSVERGKPMGAWLHNDWRTSLYTIGLYMLEGESAKNNGEPAAVTPLPPGSLEAGTATAGKDLLFMPIPRQNQPGESDDWAHAPLVHRHWGVSPIRMVPANTYDAVLVIKRSSMPVYL